jgi:hypothetical protein
MGAVVEIRPSKHGRCDADGMTLAYDAGGSSGCGAVRRHHRPCHDRRIARNRHGRACPACPGHPDAEGTAFQQNTLGIARALLIEITGTSPVMTSVVASISSEHAPDPDPVP